MSAVAPAALARVPLDVCRDPVAWRELATAQIAAVSDVGALREMQDQARAVVIYLQQKLGRATEEARAAAEVELRVKRRIGELLPPPEQGGRGKRAAARQVSPDLDHRRASEFRQLASVPEEAFEGYLADRRAAKKPPTAAGAQRATGQGPSPESPMDPAHARFMERRKVAQQASSKAAKAVSFVSEHISDEAPDELDPVLEEAHGHLAQAHRVLSAYLGRTWRRSTP